MGGDLGVFVSPPPSFIGGGGFWGPPVLLMGGGIFWDPPLLLMGFLGGGAINGGDLGVFMSPPPSINRGGRWGGKIFGTPPLLLIVGGDFWDPPFY